MKIVETIAAKLARLSAQTGAGFASTWNAYQPKEPKILKK